MSREVEGDAGDPLSVASEDGDGMDYASLLAAVGDGTFRVDADGRFVAVDEEFAAVVGPSAERLEGAHVSTVLAEGEVERFDHALEGHGDRTDRGVVSVDVGLLSGEGAPVSASLSFERLSEEDELVGAVGVVETADGPGGRVGSGGYDDVERDDGGGVDGGGSDEGGGSSESGGAIDTEWAAWERERERYRALTEAARDVIVTIDADSTIESINPAVEDLFGYQPSELVGESLTMLMPDALERQHEAALERYLRTGERSLDWDYIELEGKHADGDRIPLAISFGEVVHDGERHFTGIIRDITERQEYQRELRKYEKLVEESTDVITVIDESGQMEYATPSSRRVLGYGPAELRGQNAFELIHPEDRPEARAELRSILTDPEYRAQATFRVRHSDGSWVVVQARARNLLEDPHVGGVVVYTHDITERREYERQLERQRERLAALDQLNGVVRGVTEAVIDRSTREEIEEITCERLAASDSYEFAWIGEVALRSGEVEVSAAAGLDGDLEDVDGWTDIEDGPAGPTEAAIREGEVQVVHDVADLEAEDHGDVETGDVRSLASIPIGHEDTVYGVLNVYAGREGAFLGEEREVVSHLGETVGHAIAATERKQALMSDSVLELEVEIADLFGEAGNEAFADATVRIEQVLSIEDGEFLVYGVADESAVEEGRSLGGSVPHWGEVSTISEAADGVRFQVILTEPPALSAIASLGGSVRSALIEDGDYRMTVQFPEGTGARQVLETVREHFPGADLLARRQVTRSESGAERLTEAWLDRLTDRQRTALEVAYYAGFFEWPRDSSGEDVAETMDVAAPTFHQHVRAAERKLFAALLEEADPGESAGPPDGGGETGT